MKIVTIFFLFLSLIITINGIIIKSIYFDPATSTTGSQKDGVIVVELFNGSFGTICMNSGFDMKNARVICKMMNYTGGKPSSFAVISSKISNIGATLFQNVRCTGDETSLENCGNFNAGGNIFTCSNHNQDLHVYCYGDYEFNNTEMNIDNCGGSVSTGLLSMSSNGITAYVCGINNKFGPLEAAYFCTYTLCIPSLYARIVAGFVSPPIRVIGGFNNMSCSDTGCINVYPYQSDRCTPTNNIAVMCTNDSSIAFPKPVISCSNSSLNVMWNASIYNATIANNYFGSVFANGTNCTNVTSGATVTNAVNLTLLFGTCDMMTSGDKDNITLTFRIIRLYPKTNGVIIYPDESFNASCIIFRNQTVTQGSLLINPVGLPPSSSNTSIPNILTLYSDSAFKNKIPDLGSVAVGTKIFVLVQLVNPPPDLILVLTKCYFGSPQTLLIDNRCPVGSNVQINPISDTEKSFNFVLTQIVNSPQSTVTCQTSKCSTSETSCLSTC